MRAGLVFLSHQSFDINVNLSFFAQKIISPFLNPIFAQYHFFSRCESFFLASRMTPNAAWIANPRQ